MKNRIITFSFAFALCFVSSFALADNPSDAPLVADDAGSVAVQQEGRAVSPKQHRSKETSTEKKIEDGSTATKAKKAAKNCDTPAKASATSAL